MKPHAALTERLAETRRFDQLIALLRDELDWPIGSDDFEDLTFEYDAEELGIDKKNAAKIEEIKRLRPLVPSQPWGIFFVKFEPKRLPVVALRRILGAVAVKKRASANSAERSAWAPDDLLFVSNYGEGEERQINFAHFSRAQDGNDLPTLKVLGWDSRDTGLHLDSIARELSKHLAWPADPSDADAWRANWRSAFTLRHREAVTTARKLSSGLAELACNIRDRTKAALDIETDKGPLTRLMKAFQESLVHDLDPVGFADMYAQTIAYGLLSARIADPHKRTADDFAAHMRTNPFLRELMETFFKAGGRHGKSGGPGIDFDELGVSDVVQLLDDANMEAVVHDFGDRNPQEDPVIHFYEDFLKEYDRTLWKGRGVVYTPRPVVSYIVRSVDELLRTEFGLADGLADTTTWGEMANSRTDLKIPEGVSSDQDFVQILDPATGTGTFLVEVIDLIHKTLVAKWRKQGHGERKMVELWNEYVPRHLLTRLHGYELLMAPYAIAHLKLGLKLYETGYRFISNERARVYLTNALEPASTSQLSFDFLPALAREAHAVNEIKRHQRFTVMIGNPPYSGVSSNMTPWIDGLLRGATPDDTSSYYHLDGQPLHERKLWLQDDYVKFIRLSQYCLSATGTGIHGYISNHGYLDNPTFRGMRWSLMDSFDAIWVLDLHGNLKKKETSPDGGKDANVFEIQQGVGIGLFLRALSHRGDIGSTVVRHADLWGDRELKYLQLSEGSLLTTNWQTLPTTEPLFLFEPFDQSEAGDYNDWPTIDEVMPSNVSGVVTARDGLVIDLDRESLIQRIGVFLDESLSDVQVQDALGLKENYAWRVTESREQLRKAVGKGSLDLFVRSMLYRPFDTRLIFWHPAVVWRPRSEAMPHMLAGENLAIISCRQQARVNDEWAQVGVTNQIIESCAISNITREINYLFPLYLYPSVGVSDGALFHAWPEGKEGRRPNLDPVFVEAISKVTGLNFISDGRGDLKPSGSFGPEDVLAYMYAVFHCPEYRRRFKPMLMLDFARVPPPGATDPFIALAKFGHQLFSLHLLESPDLANDATVLIGHQNLEVEKVTWNSDTVWIDKAQTTGFQGVREEVWAFHVGGYQVCEKWLKDRKGRTLSVDDIYHYQKIVVALSETIRLMNEIEQVIEQHGGWPGAIASSK